ncbi:hypothetical protein NITLEN_70035 [Nitrospira lenta]|uniref:Uncharacterized protein n=1 Tax=Nitrospira lenta TaxID=1436998 RepID=A0A330L8Y3_9BACT|nr:hypothetical protein NITLEN_70035 [Nitrospira lenta]
MNKLTDISPAKDLVVGLYFP